MLSNNATPSLLIVPDKDRVTRRLVLRNTMKHKLLVKIVPSSRNGIHLESEGIILTPRTGQVVSLEIDTKKLKAGQQIHGFACISPEKGKEHWLKAEGSETRRQLAFTLTIRVSNAQFSALDTIIDLPGRAILCEATNHGRFGIEDEATEDAIHIEEGCTTAQPFGSMENIMTNMQKKSNGWLNWENEDCWLLNKLVGNDKKEGKKRSSVRSQYIDPDMNHQALAG